MSAEIWVGRRLEFAHQVGRLVCEGMSHVIVDNVTTCYGGRDGEFVWETRDVCARYSSRQKAMEAISRVADVVNTAAREIIKARRAWERVEATRDAAIKSASVGDIK